MSIARPVSVETLASIPWMSAKSLSHAMREVSLRGPNDPQTWTHLVSRADMIAPSFNPKQAALMMNSLARIKIETEGPVELFIRRYMRRFLSEIIPNCSPLDLAQVVHAIGSFSRHHDCISSNLIQDIDSALTQRIPRMDDKEISMTACGLASVDSLGSSDVVRALLDASIQLGNQLTDRTLAQVLNLAGIRGYSCEALVAQELVRRIPNMNQRSLILSLNAVSRLGIKNNAMVSVLSETIMNPGSQLVAIPFHQLTLLLRSLQKQGMAKSDPLCLHRIMDSLIRSDFNNQNTGALCAFVNCASRLSGYSQMIQECIRILLGRSLQPAEATLLIQSVCRMNDFDSACIKTLLRKCEFKGPELLRICKALDRIPSIRDPEIVSSLKSHFSHGNNADVEFIATVIDKFQSV
jgi:hypothetical protein